MQTTTFTQTFEAAQNGDERAAAEVVTPLLGELTAFFNRRGASDPDGAANETLDRALRSADADRIVDPSDFRAYTYAIARNGLKNEYRRRSRRVPLAFTDPHASTEPTSTIATPEDALVADLSVDSMLGLLTTEQAEVLRSRFVDDRSIEETAIVLGRSTTAVNALQRRGLLTLRRLVGATAAILLLWLGVRAATPDVERAPVITDQIEDGDGGPIDGVRIDPTLEESPEPVEPDPTTNEPTRSQPTTDRAPASPPQPEADPADADEARDATDEPPAEPDGASPEADVPTVENGPDAEAPTAESPEDLPSGGASTVDTAEDPAPAVADSGPRELPFSSSDSSS